MKKSIFFTGILAMLIITGFGQMAEKNNHEYIRYNAGYRLVNTDTRDTITINKAADNLALLRYFGQQNEDELTLYQAVFNVLSAGLHMGYRNVVTDKTVKKLLEQRKLKLFGGPMLGNITSDGLSVWVRTTAPAAVKVILMDEQGKETSFGPVNSGWDTELTATIPVHGLKPREQYKGSLDRKSVV